MRTTAPLNTPAPRVFVSYAHESPAHQRQVLRFCRLLRELGVDLRVDVWESSVRRDWFVWMMDQLRSADHVIVAASPQYRVAADGEATADSHRGVQAEASILRDLLYGDRGTWIRKILPVVLPGRSVTDIPLFLQPFTASHYRVSELSPGGVAELLDGLAGGSPDVDATLSPSAP